MKTSKSSSLIEALYFSRSILTQSTGINPEILCKIFGITIIDHYILDKDGYLVCSNGSKLIFSNAKITNAHRKKFLIAHELGHYLMHHDQLFCCENVTDGKCKVNNSLQEKEANEFASELLLPTEHLLHMLPTHRLSFNKISEIASYFDTSITMTTLKSVLNSKTEDELLLCYEDNKLRWYATPGKEYRSINIPKISPTDLTPQSNYESIYWPELSDEPISQEVFHTFGNQYLVLLSGNSWIHKSEY